jgi:hypothetical protein
MWNELSYFGVKLLDFMFVRWVCELNILKKFFIVEENKSMVLNIIYLGIECLNF